MRSKKLCATNKEALRWCKARGVKISFEPWIDSNGSGDTWIHVRLGKKTKAAKTLIQAVNKWIKYFNKEPDVFKIN